MDTHNHKFGEIRKWCDVMIQEPEIIWSGLVCKQPGQMDDTSFRIEEFYSDSEWAITQNVMLCQR